jgi:hypothetical protein
VVADGYSRPRLGRPGGGRARRVLPAAAARLLPGSPLPPPPSPSSSTPLTCSFPQIEWLEPWRWRRVPLPLRRRLPLLWRPRIEQSTAQRLDLASLALAGGPEDGSGRAPPRAPSRREPARAPPSSWPAEQGLLTSNPPPSGLLGAKAAVAVVPLHHGVDGAATAAVRGGWGGRACVRDPRVAFAPYRAVCGIPAHEHNGCGRFAGCRCGQKNGKSDLQVALPLLSRYQCRQS